MHRETRFISLSERRVLIYVLTICINMLNIPSAM